MKLQLISIPIVILLLNACSKDNTASPVTPQNKGWQNLSSMPTPRHDFGFVECNNLLYAVGGYNADGLKTVEAYDPSSDRWTTKAPMPTARAYLVVATVSNKIYAIGGITGGDLNDITYLKTTEEYDPASDTWTEKSPIPITVLAPNNVLGNLFIAGAAVNGKIYVAVGYSDGDVPTYIYDPATDTWSTGKSISKFNLQPYYATASGNNLYVSNGNDFLQYLPSSDEWLELPLPQTSIIGSVYGTCLASDNGNIYAIGGDINAADIPLNSDDVETYDPVHSAWTEDSSLNMERNAAAAIVYNKKLYVLGGASLQTNGTNVPIANFEVLSLQ
jgi:N-acetylneuraminic acid mutarotase